MVVSFSYVLKNDAGEVIDQSTEGTPLTYLHGAGNIIEGLEDGIEDLKVGDDFQVSVAPSKGYGEVEKRLISEIPKERFPEETQFVVGEKFVIDSEQGPRNIRITEIRDTEVVVDANHELAGQNLNFSGKILEIREGTSVELSHGHPHGPGGCDS
jgi:FKBP-type peptidyl-prolyl cis-trans isomerase SlyD